MQAKSWRIFNSLKSTLLQYFNNRDLYPLKSSIWVSKWHSLTLCHWSCPNASCCCGQWNGVLGEAMCYSRINSHLPWAMPSLTSGSAGRAAVSAPAGALTASPGLFCTSERTQDTVLLSSWGIYCGCERCLECRDILPRCFRDWNNLLPYHRFRRDSASVKLVGTDTTQKSSCIYCYCALYFALSSIFVLSMPRLLASMSLSAEGLHFFM